MKGKIYKRNPLPFCGSKRYYVKSFQEALLQGGDVDVIVDLFGGSGLLSRVAKDTLPHCRVIYNDFDYYINRLANIDKTNALLHDIAPLLADVPKLKIVPEEVRRAVLSLIWEHEQRGMVDYITLSASLFFSGLWARNYEQMKKCTMYNRLVNINYNASTYLNGLEVVHEDYRTLFNAHKGNESALFIVDPPYLQTDVTAYKEGVEWKLKDYLDVLTLLQENKYIFFTSDKSHILELCQWMRENTDTDFFKAAVKYERVGGANYKAKYKDVMIVKK